MPRLISIDTDSIKDITKSNNSKGFHLSLDYRFYLSKENKYNAPHGVYIGPYATYNTFNRDYKLVSSTESFPGELNANMKFQCSEQSVSSLGISLFSGTGFHLI